jgi:2-polyprenyl-3-methyl-5-hydroxy-6-metoxy-1,4-benzoquinol methylase
VPTTPPERLAVEEALDYWDERHRQRDDLRSGGDVTYDYAGNQVFYAVRLGRLLDVLGHHSDVSAPWRVLDAGCGKGWFSRKLAECGHRVDGIDASEHAIAECSRLAVGTDRYFQTRLDTWAPSYLYDAVVSVDVLFHLMDDAVWEASLRNLCRLTRYGGKLVVADHDVETERLWSSYQVSRARGRYLEVTASEGLRYDGFHPYAFRENRVGFHHFTRRA